MSENFYKIKESTLKNIANAIRKRTGEDELITPLQMPSIIDTLAEGITTTKITDYYIVKDGTLQDQIYKGEWTQQDGYVQVTFASGEIGYKTLGDAIDLTDFSTMTMEVSSVSADNTSRTRTIYIAKISDESNVANVQIKGVNESKTVTLDVSSLTGFHLIRPRGQYSNMQITNLYFTYTEPKDILTKVENNLNFEIVGSITEPASPKENTIWVNTDVNIYTYSMINTTPSWEAGEGAVCFVYSAANAGVNNQINILKKNEISIRIESCYQYINAEWVKKQFSIYKNNQWVIPQYLILDYDNEVDYTGAWTKTWGNNFSKNTNGLIIYNGASWGTTISSEHIENYGYTTCEVAYSMNIVSSGMNTRTFRYGDASLTLPQISSGVATFDISTVLSGVISYSSGVPNDASGDSYTVIHKIRFY